MVALGSFFAAAVIVGAFVFICTFLNGNDQRRAHKILILNRQKAIRQACQKSLQSLSDRSEIEIVHPQQRSSSDLHWQHAVANLSRQSRRPQSGHCR